MSHKNFYILPSQDTAILSSPTLRYGESIDMENFSTDLAEAQLNLNINLSKQNVEKLNQYKYNLPSHDTANSFSSTLCSDEKMNIYTEENQSEENQSEKTSENSEEESNTESSEDINWFFNLPMEYIIDIENFIIETIGEYMEDEIENIISSKFHNKMINYITQHLIVLLTDFAEELPKPDLNFSERSVEKLEEFKTSIGLLEAEFVNLSSQATKNSFSFTQHSDEKTVNIPTFEETELFVKYVCEEFFKNVNIQIPPRSYLTTFEIEKTEKEKQEIKQKIKELKEQYQPKQRTTEWYEYRNKILTASNIWKVFGSECQRNSLIYEKCSAYIEMLHRQPLPYSTINSFGGGAAEVKPEFFGTKCREFETTLKVRKTESHPSEVDNFSTSCSEKNIYPSFSEASSEVKCIKFKSSSERSVDEKEFAVACEGKLKSSSNLSVGEPQLAVACKEKLTNTVDDPLNFSTTRSEKFSLQNTENVGSSLHHGKKYEPLSAIIYEIEYNTKIDDFGCITHKKYPYIGASPDGINVDENTNRYGRMLEIKNITNREINGIPKEEYWVQMQIQMETCDLDECDFVETRFKEYENEEKFYEDIETSSDLFKTAQLPSQDTTNSFSSETSVNKKYRGVILYFIDKVTVRESVPRYVYLPPFCSSDLDNVSTKTVNFSTLCSSESINLPSHATANSFSSTLRSEEKMNNISEISIKECKEKINKMINEKIKEFKETEEGKNKILYEKIYWYLDEFSCVLVKRNKLWFETALPKILDISKIIERERVEGFEHRASNRIKKIK